MKNISSKTKNPIPPEIAKEIELELHGEILENIAEGVLLIRTSDELIVYANPKLERMFGYDSGELQGKHVSVLNAATEKSPGETAEEIRQSLISIGAWQGEVLNIRKDGVKFWCNANVSAFVHPEYGNVWVSLHHDITERKKTEKALQESEEKYRLLHENSGIGIGYYNPEGTIISYNRIAASHMNGTPEDFTGKSIFDIFSKEEAEFYFDRIKSAISSDKPVVYEDFVPLPIGDRYFLSTFSKIVDLQNNISGIQIISQDITVQKKAEKALEASINYLDKIINTVGSPIFVKDSHHKFCLVNNAFCTFLNLPFEKLIGVTGYEYFPKEQFEVFIAKDQEVLNTGKECVNEELITNGKREVRTCITTKTLYTDISGNKFLVGVINDITERKKAEDLRVFEKQRLSFIIEGTNVGTWEWNVQTGETIFNEQWARHMGYSLDELAPVNIDTWIRLTHPEDLRVSEELLQKHFRGELENYECEIRMRHKKGDWVWILDRGKVHEWNEEGRPLLMSGTHQDITEAKEAERRIQLSIIEAEERERMNFSQELHDGIGPLLSATKMYVQWLGMPNAKLEHKEIIKDIEKFLDESSLTIREISFKLSPHILQNFGLVEALKSYTGKIKESSKVSIRLNFENIGRFDKNYETIAYRVLCECLNNTIKHTNASEIVIDISCVNNLLNVLYSDNGQGFDLNAVMADHNSIGLLNMQSRLTSINGLMNIISSPGKGTTIKFQMEIKNK
jgi:PAS domain S-box-containing protein